MRSLKPQDLAQIYVAVALSQTKGMGVGGWGCGSVSELSIVLVSGLYWSWLSFSTVHSLYVILVMCFQLLAFELERISH